MHNNHNNILRLFDIYQILISLKMKPSFIISDKCGIYDLPIVFPNDLTLRVSGN